MVEYLKDWCMGKSHQIAPPAAGDVYVITRDLNGACMHAVAALLQCLPLQSEESDRGDLMEAKSQLFLKYFTLFMNKNILNDCGESGQVLSTHEGKDEGPLPLGQHKQQQEQPEERHHPGHVQPPVCQHQLGADAQHWAGLP